MIRPKKDRPLTPDIAKQWISYYKELIINYENWIDVYENHCEILETDSDITVAFKLYAKLQSIQPTYTTLKKMRKNIAYKDSTTLTAELIKSSIDDKELEAFVKYLVTTASNYKKRKN